MTEPSLSQILYKLNWSAEGKTWSAHLLPLECRRLIDYVEELESKVATLAVERASKVKQVDPNHNPDYVMGPEDDGPRPATTEERKLLGIPPAPPPSLRTMWRV
jgi:hypothetical protein